MKLGASLLSFVAFVEGKTGNDPVTRAQFAVFLQRYDALPDA